MHMLLMSWAGDQAQKDLMLSIRRDINEEATSAVTKLQCYGVEHCEWRPPNVLWNPEGGNIMLVDLERSEILKRVPALQETSPNKRKRLHSKGRDTVCWGCHEPDSGVMVSMSERG